MVSVLPPLSGTAPIRTLLRLVLVFCLELVLDTFSMTVRSSLAANRSGTPMSGVSRRAALLVRYMSPISPSLPFILSDQVKLWIVESSLVSSICLRRL